MMWEKLEEKLKEIEQSDDFLDGMYTYLETEENCKKMYEAIVNENIKDTDTAIYRMLENVYGEGIVNWDIVNEK